MTHILHQIDHAIELLDDAYPSVDRSIHETLERAQQEIGRLLALTTPQPIETAPRVYKRILARRQERILARRQEGDPQKVMVVTRWQETEWLVGPRMWLGFAKDAPPTHWLPLPEAPK